MKAGSTENSLKKQLHYLIDKSARYTSSQTSRCVFETSYESLWLWNFKAWSKESLFISALQTVTLKCFWKVTEKAFHFFQTVWTFTWAHNERGQAVLTLCDVSCVLQVREWRTSRCWWTNLCQLSPRHHWRAVPSQASPSTETCPSGECTSAPTHLTHLTIFALAPTNVTSPWTLLLQLLFFRKWM